MKKAVELLLVDFEGLIDNYSEYKIAIESFIGIKNQNISKNKVHFDPVNAIESIGIYTKYLKEDELQLLSGLEKWYSITIQKNQILNKSSY